MTAKIRKINEIIREIATLEKQLEREEEAIARLSASSLEVTFVNQDMAKRKKRKEELREIIEKKRAELENIRSGGAFEQITTKSTTTAKDSRLASRRAINKLNDKRIQQGHKNVPLLGIENPINDEDRQERLHLATSRYTDEDKRLFRLQREYDKDLEYIRRVEDELPEYITKNLRYMTNDRGYIYRGVWYYGERPARSYDIITMVEKKSGVDYTHEFYSDGRVIIYRRDEIVEQYMRRQRN